MERNARNGSSGQPALSVVIPTLGRPALLMTLRSLSETEIAHSLDIVVAGAISDDALSAEIRKLTPAFARLLILPISFKQGDSNKKKNFGAESSLAEIVAFIDDDVVVARDWPEKVLEVFECPEAGLMSGPGLVPCDLPLMSRLVGTALASKAAGYVSERYLQGGTTPRPVKWSRLIGCNMAYRKHVLRSAGCFDPGFWPGEEMLAAFRATRSGHKLIFHPGARVYHHPRTTLGGFCKQIYRYGLARIRLIRAGVAVEPSTLVPGLWVLSLFVLGAGALFSRLFANVLLVSLILYICACLWIVIDKYLATRRPSDLLILFLVPVMHLCYGLGEWVELFRPNRDLSERQGCRKCGPAAKR